MRNTLIASILHLFLIAGGATYSWADHNGPDLLFEAVPKIVQQAFLVKHPAAQIRSIRAHTIKNKVIFYCFKVLDSKAPEIHITPSGGVLIPGKPKKPTGNDRGI